MAKSAGGDSPLTAEVRKAARQRIRPYFDRQRVAYPPEQLKIVVVKQERRLKLYSPDHTGEWRFLMQYPIAAASGKLGPKLFQGDFQVPEGIYGVASLNAQSRFHLSMELNYPNEFDREQARRDGRTGPLGRDIMIHGNWVSTGCVALGNTAAEDMFVIVSDAGAINVKVILAPTDFRTSSERALDDLSTSQPKWVKSLYTKIEGELEKLGNAGSSISAQLVHYNDSLPPADMRAAQSLAEFVSGVAQLFTPPPKK